MFNITLKTMAATAVLLGSVTATFADVTLRGASMFDEEHAFPKTLPEFERLVGENFDGEIAFDLHLNSELGVTPTI